MLFKKITFICMIGCTAVAARDKDPDFLIRARSLFYASVEEADSINRAFEAFGQLQTDSLYRGRATVYIGALKALEGKHAFFPMTKYKHAVEGLGIMDSGIRENPQDIESLFIRGSTCYFLPFFFNRKETAQKDFEALIQLLPEEHTQYPDWLVNNVIDFLLEYAEMEPERREQMEAIQHQLEL